MRGCRMGSFKCSSVARALSCARSSQSSNIELSSLSMVAKVRGRQRLPTDRRQPIEELRFCLTPLSGPSDALTRPGRDPPSKHDQFMTEVKFYHSSQSKEVHDRSLEPNTIFSQAPQRLEACQCGPDGYAPDPASRKSRRRQVLRRLAVSRKPNWSPAITRRPAIVAKQPLGRPWLIPSSRR